MNENVSIVSFSVWLLLLYRKADFCNLFFYTATLLKMLVISGGFLVEFLRFLKYTTASVNRDNLTYSPVNFPLLLQLEV